MELYRNFTTKGSNVYSNTHQIYVYSLQINVRQRQPILSERQNVFYLRQHNNLIKIQT